MRIVLFVLPYLAFSLMCPAQETPDWEIHGGYQFAGYQSEPFQSLVQSLTAPIGFPSANVSNYVNTNGWDFSVQENANSWFGGIADVSGAYGHKQVVFIQSNGSHIPVSFRVATYTFGLGPQFSYRRSTQLQPFAHVIFAGGHSYVSHNAFSVNSLLASPVPGNASDLAFTVIGGGGIDYRLKHCAYLRVGADYIHTLFAGGGQNNFRVTAGIDFRIFTN